MFAALVGVDNLEYKAQQPYMFGQSKALFRRAG